MAQNKKKIQPPEIPVLLRKYWWVIAIVACLVFFNLMPKYDDGETCEYYKSDDAGGYYSICKDSSGKIIGGTTGNVND